MRSWLRSPWLRWVLAASLLAVAALAVADAWGAAREAVAGMEPGWLVASWALTMLSLLVSALAYRRALAAFGAHLDVPASIGVFLPAQLAKYVPGSLWPLLLQTEAGRRRAVPRATSAAALLVTLACTVGVAAAIALAGLPALWAGSASPALWSVVVVGLLAVLALLGLPSVAGVARDRWTGRAGALAGALARLRPGEVLVLSAWAALNWGLLVAATALLARGLVDDPGAVLAASVAFVIAWLAGLAAVFVPAGFGVRDGMLVLLAAPAMGEGAAVALAVLSRLVLVVADVSAAGAAVLVARRGGHARIATEEAE